MKNKDMEQIKTPLNIFSVAIVLSFLDGFLELGFNDNFYVLIGFVVMGSWIWMLWLVYKKQK